MVVPNKEPKTPTKPKTPAKPKTPTKPRKSRERSVPVPVPASATALNIINPDAAGIDVHSNMHMVCVPADRDANPVRRFGANTADLQETRRVVEEVPDQDDRFGIHRCLLDPSVRAP